MCLLVIQSVPVLCMVYLHHQSQQVAMARSGICRGHSTQMSLRRSDCFPTEWNGLNLQPQKRHSAPIMPHSWEYRRPSIIKFVLCTFLHNLEDIKL